MYLLPAQAGCTPRVSNLRSFPCAKRYQHWPVRPACHPRCDGGRFNINIGNIADQALKMAILHRKNALFDKTQNGARVGDLFMSLIYTCQLCGANPFDYLTELLKHRRELFRDPSEWMPWNYRNALERGVASGEAPS